jgi:preprotein translocase subunit SecE
MARNPGSTPSSTKARGGARPPAKPAAPAAKTATPDAPRKRPTPIQFIREVRAEARKTTWTAWKETWITSIMVFIMVVVTAIFFMVVDEALGQGMKLLLKLAA